MQTIKLIIFDLDGTLSDSLADLTDATNRMRRHFHMADLSAAEVRRMVGEGARKLVERALPGASEDEIAAGLDIFLAYNETHIADKTTLYPGVKEVLDELKRRGKLMAVVSNKNVALCRKLLAILDVDSYFAAVLGADSLPSRKPSPEPLLKLLADFSVPAEHALMVGDSINDIAAGKGAGITTVGCRYGYGDDGDIIDADYRITALPGLLELPI